MFEGTLRNSKESQMPVIPKARKHISLLLAQGVPEVRIF